MLRVCAETLACPCTLRNLKRERGLWARLSGSRSGSTACCGVTAVSCSVSLHLSFFICNRGALVLGGAVMIESKTDSAYNSIYHIESAQ